MNSDSGTNSPILSVQHLTTVFDTDDGIAYVVQDVSFDLDKGETLGIVGESGCGKTVTALSIMRLVRYPGRILSGRILFRGKDLLDLPEREMQDLRGDEIAMVFQEPMTSMNPVFSISDQITETLIFHKRMSWDKASELSMNMLARVGISDPVAVMNAYPHHLSGGMRQRVMIAMSLVCSPSLLIADEPTTAIDVTVQAQVLQLLDELRSEYGMAMLLITHNLGVVAETCDRVAIMYASRIVEYCSVRDIFYNHRHPYTAGLLASLPSVHRCGERLTIIPGQVPRPTMFPAGCNFETRCPYATEQCVLHTPPLEAIDDNHYVACWNQESVVPSVRSRYA